MNLQDVLTELLNNSPYESKSNYDDGLIYNMKNFPNIFEEKKIFKVRSKKALELYIEKGFNINLINENNGETLLHFFVKKKMYKFVEILCKKGANMEIKDKFQCTPLMCCVKKRVFYSKGILKLLVLSGANLEASDTNGTTVAHLAAKTCNSKEISFLKSMGANFDKVNRNNLTPLHFAICSFNRIRTERISKDNSLYLLCKYNGINLITFLKMKESEINKDNIKNNIEMMTLNKLSRKNVIFSY